MSQKKEIAMDIDSDQLLTDKTQSGFQVKKIYGPEDVKDINCDRDIGKFLSH